MKKGEVETILDSVFQQYNLFVGYFEDLSDWSIYFFIRASDWSIKWMIEWLFDLTIIDRAMEWLGDWLIYWHFRSVDRYGFYEMVDTEDEDALLTYSEKLKEKSSGDPVCSYHRW